MITCFYCISGFQQNEGHIPGTLKLAEKLRRKGHATSYQSRVEHRRWNCNWKIEARAVSNLGELHGESVVVAIFAYSWGGGYGAMQFSRQLRRLGIQVKVMVLSDPVYRHPWLLLRPLSMLHRDAWLELFFFRAPIIRVPDNVNEVYSYFQRMNRPQGHRLLETNGTKFHRAIELKRVHQEMDDAPEFHGCCEKVAREVSKMCDLANANQRRRCA